MKRFSLQMLVVFLVVMVALSPSPAEAIYSQHEIGRDVIQQMSRVRGFEGLLNDAQNLINANRQVTPDDSDGM